jgi:hypothetical protein
MSLARVNQLLAALPGCDLPAELRRWLLRGFERWQAGHDIETALNLGDLDAPRMDFAERDDMIRYCINFAPGESAAARMAFFIECTSGCVEHPDASAQGFIRMLRSSRVYVPSTIRHLRRIMRHRRCDGWRYQ